MDHWGGTFGSTVSLLKVFILKSKQFIIPGFIDTHIHAPQYVFTGTGYDLTLLKVSAIKSLIPSSGWKLIHSLEKLHFPILSMLRTRIQKLSVKLYHGNNSN